MRRPVPSSSSLFLPLCYVFLPLLKNKQKLYHAKNRSRSRSNPAPLAPGRGTAESGAWLLQICFWFCGVSTVLHGPLSELCLLSYFVGGWLRLRLLAADLLPFVVSDLSQGSAYGRVNSLMYHFALLSPVNDALLHAKS